MSHFSEIEICKRQLTQVRFSALAMIAFVKLAKESSSLSEQKSEKLINALNTLLEQIDKEIDPRVASEKLITCIYQLNESLDKKIAKYPDFTVNAPHSRIQLMNQILAFEQFLGLLAKLKDIPVSQESTNFTDAYLLWQKVSQGEIKPEEAVIKFVELIKGTNKELPDINHYPLPDINTY